MKKKLLMISCTLLMCISIVKADTYTGIIATVEGGETSYALSEIPTVTYGEQNGVKTAMITLQGKTESSLTVLLKDEQMLTIVYGTYVPAGIEESKVEVKEQNGKKCIIGGRLVIIGNDGKLYNINGTEIK